MVVIGIATDGKTQRHLDEVIDCNDHDTICNFCTDASKDSWQKAEAKYSEISEEGEKQREIVHYYNSKGSKFAMGTVSSS